MNEEDAFVCAVFGHLLLWAGILAIVLAVAGYS